MEYVAEKYVPDEYVNREKCRISVHVLKGNKLTNFGGGTFVGWLWANLLQFVGWLWANLLQRLSYLLQRLG